MGVGGGGGGRGGLPGPDFNTSVTACTVEITQPRTQNPSMLDSFEAGFSSSLQTQVQSKHIFSRNGNNWLMAGLQVEYFFRRAFIPDGADRLYSR